MKNKFLSGLVLLLFISCSNFIEEDDKSNINSDLYYKTKDGFNALNNANYAQLKGIYGNDAYIFEGGTDLCADGVGRSRGPFGLTNYALLTPTSDDSIDTFYTECYKAIQVSNMVIYYAPLTEPNPNISRNVGEAKYIRANAYFLLVQTFGGVGIVKDYISSAQLEFNRNSAEQVYDLIIQDLNEALNSVSTGNFSGRVTRRAVQHLLAKVHLTRGYESFGTASDFTTAATLADAAINGQALTLTPSQLWLPPVSGNEVINSETLFSIQYSSASNAGTPAISGHKQCNFYSSFLGQLVTAGTHPWRSYDLLPTQHFLSLFVKEDKRYAATFMNVVFNRYYGHYDGNTGGGTRHYYVPQWETSTETATFVAANPGVIVHPWGTYQAGLVTADFQTIPVKKFDDPRAPFVTNGKPSTRDIIHSRLGETYLIAAEAYLKSGNLPVGLQRLNAVRTRAGITSLASFTIDDLLDERARELFGEYHRWFDLKRTGKLVERASLHNFQIQASNFNGNNGNQKILRPIPQSVIDLNRNKNFPQNPAY